MKLITKQIEVTMFVANDGTEFDNLDNCLSYEFDKILGSDKHNIVDMLFIVKVTFFSRPVIAEYRGGRYFDIVSYRDQLIFNNRFHSNDIEHIYRITHGEEILLPETVK